jgi:hypothetical protein
MLGSAIADGHAGGTVFAPDSNKIEEPAQPPASSV